MGFFTKSGWVFLLVVILFSFGMVGFIKNDSFFGLYSFEEDEFTFYEPSATDVFFCPEDACATQLISQINKAESSIDIAIYSFTNNSIADALVEAKERDVKVRIVFDYLQASAEYSLDELVEAEGIAIKIRKGSGSMHNKFIVIDGEKIMTGSYNYSRNADERNDENLIFILDAILAGEYAAEFNEIWASAKTRSELN
jgi:phosphatidylserine/phosphatidylglycerophosphate/cardiolipin synthase-like enzyme